MKSSYKVPDSLDKSMLDVEINLKNDQGMGLKPIPVRVVIYYILAAMFGFWFVTQTFMAQATWYWQMAFVILYAALVIYLFIRNETGQSQYALIAPMVQYLKKGSRYVLCRNTAAANDFRDLTGIASVDPDTGLLKFTDSEVGYAYRVVGSGSVLLFDSDKRQIIDQTEKFFLKIKPGWQLIFITTREPQQIGRQARVMQARYQALQDPDPELQDLMEAGYQALRTKVGQDSRSIHQYLVLKAANMEELKKLRNVFQAEAQGSPWVFKQAQALFDKELYAMLASIYGGRKR